MSRESIELESVSICVRAHIRSRFSHSQKTVEKTVKPLKPGENVVTSEHNNNGPQKRSGRNRERNYHLEQAKLK